MLTANNTEKQELTLSEVKLFNIGTPLLVLVSLCVVLYYLIWGIEPLLWGVQKFFSYMCVPIVLIGLFLNEFFYRLTLAIFCKFPMSTFWYGFNLGQLMKCGDRDIPAGVDYYRLALFLPHLIVGVFPLIFGVVINHPIIFIFGFVFTIASVGDLVLLWEMRHLSSRNAVSELSSREGIAVEDEVSEE
ncbi:hypothetical protein [uncultured Acetobacteroides sp.]|uniref:hypothetical protein n=1 Tax=uncultured Acetobacteroides sp. TaxID=1760811 RepID=UPI0029F48F5E|nr:hypothetical protein [uncultured Acetobacteroides sp.]